MWRTFLVILAGAASACASSRQSIYEPIQHTGTLISGYPAAVYPVAGGDVRVASFGATEVVPKGEHGPVRVLQARMILTNTSEPATWLLDTRNVKANVPALGEHRASFVNTDSGELPMVEIHPGEKKIVDFYFPMREDTPTVPIFTVQWQLETAQHTVAQLTTFERHSVEPDYTREDVGIEPGLGWGADWYGRPVAIASPPVRVR
jgi:hypothetical protein